MGLENTLAPKKTKDTDSVTLYHAARDINDFKSFFREGAKPIGGIDSGQTEGFYVYTTKEKAIKHADFYFFDLYTVHQTGRVDAMIIGVEVPKKSICYPLWQQDMEISPENHDLWVKYSDFINQKGKNLHIPITPKDQHRLSNLTVVTGFSHKTVDESEEEQDVSITSLLDYEIKDVFFCEGIDNNGKKRKIPFSPLRKESAFQFQVLTDWLCQQNSEFRKEYDELMQTRLTKGE